MTVADGSSLVTRLASMLSGIPLQRDQTATAHAAALLCDQLVLAGPLPDERGSAEDRAAARALAGSAIDRDDVHWGQLVHPGSIVWPTALELAIECGSSGLETMRAASIGYEAMVRLATLFPLDARPAFHISAVVGPAAAAATASALLMPAGRVSPHALGHALSVAGGSSGALRERSGTRLFHRAHAVRTGIAAARSAAEGLTATDQDLENAGGVLSLSDRAQLEGLLAGDHNALTESSIRLFPTSGWFQCAYEAALLAARGTSGTITTITVTVPPSIAERSTSFEEGTSTWDSLDGSVAHAVARAREGASIAELADRVIVETSHDLAGARVRIVDSLTTESTVVRTPLGHPTRPETLAHRADIWGMPVTAAEVEVELIQAALESPRPFRIPRPGRTAAREGFSNVP